MLLRKKNSNIILKTMNSNKHDFIRIRGQYTKVYNKTKHIIKSQSDTTNESLTWNTNSFIITGAPTRFKNDNTTPSGKIILHVAFIASKKTISKLATIRNYVKRKMRSMVNDNIRGKLPIDYDYIFIAKRVAIDLPYKEMCDQFIWACNHFNRLIDKKNLQKG